MLTVLPGFRSSSLFFSKQLQSLMEDTARGFPDTLLVLHGQTVKGDISLWLNMMKGGIH